MRVALILGILLTLWAAAAPASCTAAEKKPAALPTAGAGTLLWQLGKADDSAAEFTDYRPAAAAVAVPADWRTRSEWGILPKGLRASTNPALEIGYQLPAVPEHGVIFSFKLLHAPKSGAQMAVFSNRLMAGLIQLWGTAETNSPYRWKKTYRLYIPREMLVAGANVLRLEATRPLWSDASVDARVWWEWDSLKLESLAAAPREPIHGTVAYLGTTMKQNEGFNVNDDYVRTAPAVFKWLGVAYSGNTMRADYWYDVGRAQPRRLEYLQLLRDLNLTAMVDFVSGSHFRNDKDGRMPAKVQADMDAFFKQYGDLFQYYELGNEPCMFGGGFAEYLETARYVDKIKPPHVKTVAAGWAYGGGKGTPINWDADVNNRRRIEALCQATNGHSYGYSYAENRGGSFVENLATYQGVEDGWPVEYLNSETGCNDWHSEENGPRFASTQPHAQAFDRILRAHLAVVDRTMQHASIFGDFGMLKEPANWTDPNVLTAYPATKGESDTRLKSYRRLALAYATHGAPLPYTVLEPEAVAGRKVYFRAVDTAAIPGQPGSQATSNKVLLNFINFENAPQTLRVRVTLPRKGAYAGERFGPGDTYAASHSTVTLDATPTLDLSVDLPAGESVQYILTPPGPGVPYPTAALQATPGDAQVSLEWPACAGASSYEVRQAAAAAGPFRTVARGLAAPRYTAAGLANGKRCYFTVVAANAAGASAPSPVASTVAGVPLPPTEVQAIPGNGQIALRWVASARAKRYEVHRAPAKSGPYQVVADKVTGTSYTETGLPNDTPCFYTVTALNRWGTSAASAPAQASPEVPPAAPSALSATAGDGRVVLRWAAVPGAVSYVVKRADTAGGPYTTIAPDCVGTEYSDDDARNGQAYRYVVAARKLGPEGDVSAEGSAQPEAGALPSPWQHADIGKIGRPGTASYNPGTKVYTVTGSGEDMWAGVDGAHFAYVPLPGDGSLTAHVASTDNTHSFCKVGVMLRERLAAGSAMALLHLSPNGTGFCFRAQTDGKCEMVGGDAQSWLRIVRQGDTVSGFVSRDGQAWRPRGTMKLPAGKPMLVGLTVCSHNNGVLNKTLFDNVVLE